MPPPTPTRRPATELTLTRSATRRGSRSAALSRWESAAWATYSSPWRLSATIRSHSSTGASTIGPSSITPALLMTMSSRPSSRTVRSTAATACSRSVASVSIDRPPICSASASRRSLRRAATATVAPSAASARAVASPMPLLAPVTRATVSCSALLMPGGLHGAPLGHARRDRGVRLADRRDAALDRGLARRAVAEDQRRRRGGGIGPVARGALDHHAARAGGPDKLAFVAVAGQADEQVQPGGDAGCGGGGEVTGEGVERD